MAEWGHPLLHLHFNGNPRWQERSPIKPAGGKGNNPESCCHVKADRKSKGKLTLFPVQNWLLTGAALDPVFGRISVMDNPSNSFSVWLWSSVGITLPELGGWGGEGRQAAFCSSDSGLCDEQKFPFCPSFSLFWKYLFQLELHKISCPRLSQNNACVFQPLLEMGVGGGGEALWITAQAQSLTRALPTLYCCLTCWKSVWDWVFSARRAGMEGGKLDGSQFIVSPESTTDRSPRLLPSSADRLGARARGQHYQSTRSYPQPLTIDGPLPRGTRKRESNGKQRICCAFKYTCSWPKITPLLRHRDWSRKWLSVKWESCSVQKELGMFGERDHRSWPSSLGWSENLCTSALPPPKPKPLLLQSARGSVCSTASRSLRQWALPVQPTPPGSRLGVCDLPQWWGSVRAAGHHGAGPEGSEGWRCRTWERLKQVAATVKKWR